MARVDFFIYLGYNIATDILSAVLTRRKVLNEITAITPQIKDKTRCNVYVDGRFYCGLTLETTMKNRLKVGMVVTEEYLSQIQLDSEKETAFDKALSHISLTRKTEKQVRTFLQGKGYLPGVVDYVIEKMRSYQFLNDGEYAEAYVESVAKKKGGRLIRMELRQKGVSDEEIDGALQTLDNETQLIAATTILQKYMRNKLIDRESLQKAYRYLLGKGFDYDTVKSVISTLCENEDE